MNPKMTKTELMLELQAAQKRIAELEGMAVKQPARHSHSKSAENALELGETLFKHVFQISPCLMALSDAATGEYVEVNDAHLKTLGHTREEMIGKTSADIKLFVNPKQRETLLEQIKVHGKLQNENILIHSKEGTVRHGVLGAQLVHAQGHDFLLSVINDVTEIKLAEERLQKSESYYRALIAKASDMIMVINELGMITFVSPASEHVMGYTSAELVGRDFRETVHPDDLSKVNQSFVHRSQTPGTAPAPLKVRILHKDGDWRVVEALGTNMFEDPIVHGLILNVHDITERERATQAIQASEANYRNLVENSESAIAVLDKEGNILFSNAQAIDVWQDPHLTGKNIHDIFPSEYADRYMRAIQLVIDTNNGLSDEVESLVSNRTMWFRISMTPLKDSDGTISKLLINAWDITERKHAEDTLKTNERVLRLFVEYSPASIAMFDHEMRYLAVSRRYLQDYNLGDQDLTGRSHYEVFPEINEWVKQIHQRCLNGATERADEDPFLREDGHLDWVHWEIHPWYEQVGKVGGIILFSEVVTDRKVAQERLRESEDRYHQFISQSLEGILRIELDEPADTSLPVEEQIDQIYENAYLAEGNQAMADIYNLPLDVFVGMRMIDMHSSRGGLIDHESLRRLITSGYRSINNETIVYMDDRRSAWLLNNIVGTIRDGKLIRLWITAIDISDRKLAEQSLLESEEKYRTLINATSDGVFVAQEEKFVFCNASLPAMLGYTLDEFEDMPFAQVVVPEHLTMWTSRFHNRINGDPVVSNYEVQFMDKVGKKIWVELRANRIKYGGQFSVLGIVRDITDQKQILEQIESLAKFPAENPGPVLRLDLSGKLLYANEASYAMLTEWTLEVGKPAPTTLINVAMLVLESGQDKTIETVHHGRVVTLNLVLLANGSYINIYGRDITEQRQAEEKLRESETRAHAMLDAIPDLMFRMDHQGVFLDYKADIHDLYTQDISSIIGLRNRDITPPEFSRLIEQKIKETLDTGKTQTFEYRLPLPDKSVHDYEAHMAVSGANEVVAVVRDITERKKMERELIEVNERFTELAENVSDIFWISEPGTRWNIYVSLAFNKIVGRSLEDVRSLPNQLLDVILPEDQHIVIRERELEDSGFKTEMTYRIIRPDGSIRWIQDKGTPVFDKDGKVIRVVGIASDITERKLAEFELQKRASQLTLINDVGSEIAGVLDIQGVLDLSARLVHESFGYHHVGLFTINENKNEIVMRSKAGKYALLFPAQHQIKLGEGIVGTVAALGDMVITNQVTENSSYKNFFPEVLDTVSELGLPIKIAGQVIGVLDVQSPQPNAFNSNDIQVLQTLADQVAIALENARLYESVQKELAERKQAEKERQVLIHDLGERVKELTALHQAARLFQNPDLSEAEMMQSLVDILPHAWQYPESAAARIVLGMDEYTSPDFIETIWIQKTSFTLPDDRTGSIEIAYLKESPVEDEGPFQKEERALLETLAERLQSSMARRYMESSLRKRTEDLTNLAEAGRTFSETLDPKRIYPLIYQYIARVMPCEFVIVSSYDPKTEHITCEYLHTVKGTQDVSHFPTIPLEPPGRGTQSLVIRSGEPLFLSDYQAALKTASNIVEFNDEADIIEDSEDEEESARSAIIVPLKVSGAVAGALQVLSLKPNAFTQDHLRFTESLASYASAALSNAHLFSELEERVRQRTAEVQDLYDNAPAGYHSLDTYGKILLINQTELNWLGYTREEVAGRHITNFMTPDSVQTFQEAFPIFKLRGTSNNLELEMRRKDGTTFPVLVNATAIKDEEGNYLMSRSTVFDNTERRKAELALRESEEQNRLLFEESPEAVVLFDQAGRVVRMNRAFETITGVKGEQFVGHLVMEFGILPRDLMDALSAQVTDKVEAGDRFASLEFKLKHASNDLRDISARIFVVNLQGRPHYLASMHDITTRKRAEETLRLANAEMERALRLKDEFLANMSHELRTPLNAILGITESLLEKTSGPLNEKQQKYLQTVLESAQHLLELINDILDLAKINAGRIELDISKVDVRSVAQSSMRMIRELAQKKGLDVKLEVEPSIKTVLADERRLKQMLVNLLSNAVKFTPKDGHIGLDIRPDQSGNALYFTVWDTGIGVNEHDLHLLFQPFVQLDAGLARGSQGTGLGLVLVSQMARLHGGSVSVESQPDMGSRFTVAIPWQEAASTAPLIEKRLPEQKVEPPSVEGKNRSTILIVEDTEAVIMLVSDYLKLHGFRVVTAPNGYEGIIRAKETNPDLILMDVMMPEMDGLETTRQIRDQLGMKDVPIIALTALAMAGDKERCLAAGMNDYLSKPVKLKELLIAIEKNLNSSKGAPNEQYDPDRGR